MSNIGYRAFLELGFIERKNGNFISFGDELIELDVCSYSLIRSVDERGKIQTGLRGGNISFVFSGLPSLAFLDWCTSSNRDSSRIETKDAKQRLINRIDLNPEVSLNVSMILGKHVYSLRSFEIEFNQEVDNKGEPQSNVSGGIAGVALYSLPDEDLNRWLRSGEGKDGRFLFGDDLIGYPLTMDFKNACCLGYFVEIQNYSEDNVTAKLNIIPQSIDFGNGVQFKAPYRY